ncbi:MAG: hypothetical protein R3C05_28870 [Pirellulaceae bacterium]
MNQNPNGFQNEKHQLIEIGVIIAGPLDDVDRRASAKAIEMTREKLREFFPDFHFEITAVGRPELATEGKIPPSVLLQRAVENRDAKHWDFSFVLTAADLSGMYAPYCFAALSRPFDAAIFSLSLIDPIALDAKSGEENRIDRIAKRLMQLMLHAVGHLTGLSPSSEPRELMYHPASASEIDSMEHFSAEQLQRQRQSLAEIADQRLEESSRTLGNYWLFASRAIWINRREIVQAIWGARPWEFPRRLSRLTLASVSTVAVLLMTAEAWELGLSQPWHRVLALIIVSIVITTAYVVTRQQLLLRRNRQHSEQTVMTSMSAIGIVLVGMLVTWIGLVAIGLSFSWMLFEDSLISGWAGSTEIEPEAVGWTTYLQMSGFCASVGLLIGALGASFESQNYFRHVIFVDEEI